jgi:hypothetical protein
MWQSHFLLEEGVVVFIAFHTESENTDRNGDLMYSNQTPAIGVKRNSALQHTLSANSLGVGAFLCQAHEAVRGTCI